ASPHSAPYEHEGKRPRYTIQMCEDGIPMRPAVGVTLEGIKDRCKTAGLSPTGNRFTLVLRLVQSASGIGEPKKMRAPRTPKTGPKGFSKGALPDARKMVTKVEKIAYPGHAAAMKLPNDKVKRHMQRVVQAVNKGIESQVLGKDLIERGKLTLAWQIVDGLNEVWCLSDNSIRGWGRIGYDLDLWVGVMTKFMDRCHTYLQAHPEEAPTLQAISTRAALYLTQVVKQLRSYGYEGEGLEEVEALLNHPLWGEGGLVLADGVTVPRGPGFDRYGLRPKHLKVFYMRGL
ncbi:hypothetical protein KIPB_001146, partial [Kipferlia bialata]